MILVSWNCRGLGHPAAIPFLCELVKACKPNKIFLHETISRTCKIDEIGAHLSYDCSFTVDCISCGGGLCVFWKFSSVCNLVSYSQNHIELIINDVDGPWHFTGFYGHPQRNKRRFLGIYFSKLPGRMLSRGFVWGTLMICYLLMIRRVGLPIQIGYFEGSVMLSQIVICWMCRSVYTNLLGARVGGKLSIGRTS